jgi:ribonucleoside-diphosphate reductase beta chain
VEAQEETPGRKYTMNSQLDPMGMYRDADVYRVYSKKGCTWCEDAATLLKKHDLPFEVVECSDLDNLRMRLGPLAPHVDVFPFVTRGSSVVGGYHNLRDSLDEPLLQEDMARLSAFPIEMPDVFELYKKAVASFWTADEINLRQDADDFATLSKDERHFLSYVLAFFASSDGIINENIMGNFANEVQKSEPRLFYAFQAFNEAEHNRTYSMLIDALIKDPEERDRLFNAILHVPAVKAKASWALKWFDRTTKRFAERLVAFACVEGILFSGSFCAIFWLKSVHNGKMPGLSLSNQFIARDEALHCEHAALLYRKLRNKLAQDEVEAIISEAVENEKRFITEALPPSLVGINATLMAQYIEFVADHLLLDLGHTKMYRATNPFPFMEQISLQGKSNFFETTVSEYSRAGIMGDFTNFSLDADF